VKLVIGIVRPEKANEVMEALYRAEIRGFSVSRVQGHGGELERVETYRGTTVKMELSEKTEALCEGGRTGSVGDGKIFVIDLAQSVRIRTGETAEGAVTPVAP
jgi:nitrogen regulatory protein PII